MKRFFSLTSKRKKANKPNKQRKSKFLDRYGKRIESIRNTDNIKRINRDKILQEEKQKNDEQANFIENVLEKIQRDKEKQTQEEKEIPVKIVRKCNHCGQILSENAHDCWKCSSTDIVEVAEEDTEELEMTTLYAKFQRLEDEFKKYKVVSFVMIALFALLLLLYIIK